jgi:hypothetical protein
MALPQDEVLAFLELDIPDLPFDVNILARLEANELMSDTLQAEVDAGRGTPEILALQDAVGAHIHTDLQTLSRIGAADR